MLNAEKNKILKRQQLEHKKKLLYKWFWTVS